MVQSGTVISHFLDLHAPFLEQPLAPARADDRFGEWSYGKDSTRPDVRGTTGNRRRGATCYPRPEWIAGQSSQRCGPRTVATTNRRGVVPQEVPSTQRPQLWLSRSANHKTHFPPAPSPSKSPAATRASRRPKALGPPACRPRVDPRPVGRGHGRSAWRRQRVLVRLHGTGADQNW